MKRNNDKFEVKKPKSMILDEIVELERKKFKTDDPIKKLMLNFKINNLKLQLRD